MQTAALSFSSGHSLQPVKQRWGGLGHLLKIALLRGECFGLKSFSGEVVEGKKMLFHTFFEVLMVGVGFINPGSLTDRLPNKGSAQQATRQTKHATHGSAQIT